MRSPRELMPALTGIVFSLIGMGFAWWSWRAFMSNDVGNSLIFAGGALSFCTLPMSRLTRPDARRPTSDAAAEEIRKPEPLPMRIAIGFAWLLILAGLASFLF